MTAAENNNFKERNYTIYRIQIYIILNVKISDADIKYCFFSFQLKFVLSIVNSIICSVNFRMNHELSHIMDINKLLIISV